MKPPFPNSRIHRPPTRASRVGCLTRRMVPTIVLALLAVGCATTQPPDPDRYTQDREDQMGTGTYK
ncbi:MAG: hypothetical protein AB7O66_16625 [Limisphaerales bacterium]